MKFYVMRPLFLLFFMSLFGVISCGSGSSGGDDAVNIPPAVLEVTDDSPSPGSINIPGTVGQTSSILRFNVLGDNGQPATDGHRINFSIQNGPNGGEELSSTSAKTSGGSVSTVLYSGNKSGIVTVRASADSNPNAMINSQVLIIAGPPAGEEFGISAEYLNISGLHLANLQDSITVNLADIFGNAVPDNTNVAFRTYNTGGTFLSQEVKTTDGRATNTLSSSAPDPLEGFVSVTAETSGSSALRVSAIEVTPSPNSQIVYAGTSGGGVYKSTDSGQSWTNISRSSENSKMGQNWIDPFIKGHSALAVDPEFPNTVYAGTGNLGRGRIYRSVDGGLNWNSGNTEEVFGLLRLNSAILSILCDDLSDYVWVGTEGNGALLSTDGETFQWGGTATMPFADFRNAGQGSMTQPKLSGTTQSESWTVTYDVIGAEVLGSPLLDTSRSGSDVDGTLTNLSVTSSVDDEAWTLRFEGKLSQGDTIPSENGLLTIDSLGQSRDETYTVTYDNSTGDDVFEVVSSVRGLVGFAESGDASYAYSDGFVTFSIAANPGQSFEDGESFRFNTSAGTWEVRGSKSGVIGTAYTGQLFTSSSVSFLIEEGNTPYQNGDTWTFTTTRDEAWEVEGTVSGLQNKKARTGVPYSSDNSEVSFTINAGSVPFAIGDRFTFSTQSSGLGAGNVVHEIVKVPGTHEDVAVLYAATANGVYRSENGGFVWSKPASFPGDSASCIALHPSSDGFRSDLLFAGTEDAGVWSSQDSGQTWTQHIEGMTELQIQDLFIDPLNSKLYASATQGGGDLGHAVGNVYVHNLGVGGGLASGSWGLATSGLPQFNPPSDTSLFAQYVFAADDPNEPSTLFIGGEGHNLFRAESGLRSGALSWEESDAGITDLIMARMPILFTDTCTMSIDRSHLGGNNVLFRVYIEDENGNPPIEGSTFTAALEPESGSAEELIDVTYADAYTAQGTWRDRSDPSTNNPYYIPVTVRSGDEVVFTYNPACGDSAPGCSGGNEHIETYPF